MTHRNYMLDFFSFSASNTWSDCRTSNYYAQRIYFWKSNIWGRTKHDFGSCQLGTYSPKKWALEIRYVMVNRMSSEQANILLQFIFVKHMGDKWTFYTLCTCSYGTIFTESKKINLLLMFYFSVICLYIRSTNKLYDNLNLNLWFQQFQPVL